MCMVIVLSTMAAFPFLHGLNDSLGILILHRPCGAMEFCRSGRLYSSKFIADCLYVKPSWPSIPAPKPTCRSLSSDCWTILIGSSSTTMTSLVLLATVMGVDPFVSSEIRIKYFCSLNITNLVLLHQLHTLKLPRISQPSYLKPSWGPPWHKLRLIVGERKRKEKRKKISRSRGYLSFD